MPCDVRMLINGEESGNSGARVTSLIDDSRLGAP